MHRPVRVTPPADLIDLAAAKMHLRVDGDSEDAMIAGMARAAVDYLDGWSGVLGRCLVSQDWEQRFDRFDYMLRLPFPDVTAASVVYTDDTGAEAVFADAYDVREDGMGAWLDLRPGHPYPSAAGGLTVRFTAGYGAPEDVPAPIVQAALLQVGTMYAFRETMAEKAVPSGVYKMMISPYRRRVL